jgi:hypothetical protein
MDHFGDTALNRSLLHVAGEQPVHLDTQATRGGFEDGRWEIQCSMHILTLINQFCMVS